MPVIVDPPPDNTPTYSSVIEETLRRLMPAQLDLTVQLVGDIDNEMETVVVSGAMSNRAIAYGEILSCEMELMYVQAWNQTTLTAQVIRGAQGSTPAHHGTGSTIVIQPKFSRFDIGQAINQELNSLSGAGLFQIKTADITYNPTYMGYDLPHDPGLIDVIGVRYKIAPPTRNYPTIKHWAVLPAMTDTDFPSGMALVVYSGGYPGLPMHIWYSSAFDSLIYLTDPISRVSGLPFTAVDILSVGASIIAVHSREVKRNFMEAQPDPRKAPEVPPQAVMNSTKGLEMWRANRISEERGRLMNQTKYLRRY